MPAIMEFGRLLADPLIALHRLKNLGQLFTDADADVELCLTRHEGSGHLHEILISHVELSPNDRPVALAGTPVSITSVRGAPPLEPISLY